MYTCTDKTKQKIKNKQLNLNVTCTNTTPNGGKMGKIKHCSQERRGEKKKKK